MVPEQYVVVHNEVVAAIGRDRVVYARARGALCPAGVSALYACLAATYSGRAPRGLVLDFRFARNVGGADIQDAVVESCGWNRLRLPTAVICLPEQAHAFRWSIALDALRTGHQRRLFYSPEQGQGWVLDPESGLRG